MEEQYQKIMDKLEEIQLTNREILSAKGAAKYLEISLNHLYKLTMQNKIRYYKPGGKNAYFQKSDLDKYMLQNEIKTAKEIEQKAANFNYI